MKDTPDARDARLATGLPTGQLESGKATEISVIIPAYGHCPHLVDLVSALLNGDLLPDEIIVSHSGSEDPTLEVAGISDRVTVLHHSGRLLAGAARNRGAAAARTSWLAFVDADVRPRDEWLKALWKSCRPRSDRFVVGSVGYATSGGYWGMCNWICEFSELAPWHAARAQTGGASCNMIVRAADFLEVGGFPEGHQPGEDTVTFSRLASHDRQQWFDPAARVDHHNRPGLRQFLTHQYRLGYHSALVRQRIPLRGSLATRIWPLAMILWLPRFVLLTGRLVRGGPVWWVRGTVLAPGVLLGCLIWTTGFLRRLRESSAASEPLAYRDRQASIERRPSGRGGGNT